MLYDKIVNNIDSIVIIDANIKDICEEIENMILEEGYRLAFPVNISLNSVAAHSTASSKEERIVKEDDLIKIDFGYMDENGEIFDNAISINLNEKHKELIEVTKESVMKAIEHIKPGVSVDEVSEIIYNTITSKGFKPIDNLTGHRISKSYIHDEPSIPSIKSGIDYKFQVGDRFAIEVFSTYPEGAGTVVETKKLEIMALVDLNKSKVPRRALNIYDYILENYGTLPFARRWVVKKFGEALTNMAIYDLLFEGFLEPFPELVEKNLQPVAQYERTIIVEESGAKII